MRMATRFGRCHRVGLIELGLGQAMGILQSSSQGSQLPNGLLDDCGWGVRGQGSQVCTRCIAKLPQWTNKAAVQHGVESLGNTTSLGGPKSAQVPIIVCKLF